MVLAMNLLVRLTLATLPVRVFVAVLGVPPALLHLDTAANCLLLVIAFPVGFVFARFIMRREVRRLDRMKANIRKRQDEHAGLGDVVIQVIGEDARAQWPKIRRQLDDSAQAVNEYERSGAINTNGLNWTHEARRPKGNWLKKLGGGGLRRSNQFRASVLVLPGAPLLLLSA